MTLHNALLSILRLARMRHSAGGSLPESLRWAICLLLQNHRTARQRRHLDRKAEVERAARQRL